MKWLDKMEACYSTGPDDVDRDLDEKVTDIEEVSRGGTRWLRTVTSKVRGRVALLNT